MSGREDRSFAPGTLGRNTIESMTLAVAIVDGTGRILAVNRAWRRLAVSSRGDALCALDEGDDYLEAATTASEHVVAEGVRAVLGATSSLFSYEFGCHRPRDERWLFMSVLRLPGATVRAAISYEDVTEKRIAARSLGEAQHARLRETTSKLQHRNRDLAEIATVTSDDLRTPLRGILNLTTWIEEDLGERATPEILGHLRMLHERIARMEALIGALREYARVGLEPAPVVEIDVRAMLAALVRKLDPPPTLAVEISPTMPTLRAPRASLQRVFKELLGNAIAHHHTGRGRIAVLATEVDGHFEFCVADDGPGIDSRQHERVFRLFQTAGADGSRAVREPRTGVGLALVRRIVEDQGGDVRIESQPGAGAKFCFTWRKEPA